MSTGFPYDKRNEDDYREITKNISVALELINNNPKIPATQKELSWRARCSRGTLRLRKWPLDRLKEIKARRRAEQSNGGEVTSIKPAVEIHLEDKKRLLEQLKNSRSQNAILVFEKREIEIENKKLQRALSAMQIAKTSLEERCRKYEAEVALQGSHESDSNGGEVILFKPKEEKGSKSDE